MTEEKQDQPNKSYEMQLRRRAQRAGFILSKSRARSWSFNNQQGYRLQDFHTSMILWGSNYELELQDVEGYLNNLEESSK